MFFKSLAARHLFPMEESQIFCKATINKVNRGPRGCPPPGRLLDVGTLHKRHTLFTDICQNLLLIIWTSENQFESSKGRMKPLGNSYYNK